MQDVEADVTNLMKLLLAVLGIAAATATAVITLQRRQRPTSQIQAQEMKIELRSSEGLVEVQRITPRDLYIAMMKKTLELGREIACVVYSDGTVRCFVLGAGGGCYPIERSDVVEIVHTHPIPRWTPSVVDIASAYRLSVLLQRPVPFKVVSYIPEKNELIVYEYKVDPRALPEEIAMLLDALMPFEEMCICIDPELAAKYQHEVMKMLPYISVTRYVIKLQQPLVAS